MKNSNEDSAMCEQMLALIPEMGSIGNINLRNQLAVKNWSFDDYWRIRNNLIERGELEAGRGRGGSVRRVAHALPEESEAIADGFEPIETTSERSLYPEMRIVIENDWAKSQRLDTEFCRAEITAYQGGRRTGGIWTRPDITLVNCQTFTNLPGRYFEIITFEIKPWNALDVKVIYEALAHRRSATRAYALLHIPENEQHKQEALLDELVAEAKCHGVGLIIAGNPRDFGTWEELVEARRHDPEPVRMNDLLAQVSQDLRDRIARWFR